ncbi:hypothetical protein JXA40_04265 [bacterium]|nr:hypothetical protein [candidate division CSSED10-310 bacterium]
MKRTEIWLALTICLILAGTINYSSAQNEVDTAVKLQYTDPFGRLPISRMDYLIRTGQPEPIRIHRSVFHPAPDSACRTRQDTYPYVALFVNQNISGSLQDSLDGYIADLTGDGYDTDLIEFSGLTAAGLKTALQGLTGEGLVGAVLIGESPVAWYEMDDEEFPIDLYFMDLDGTWSDSDGDGLWDAHSGNVSPEIWIGRIDASSYLRSSEITLLQNYFQKNHAYRTGALSVPKRGLAFVDDDWSGYGSSSLTLVYDNVTTINSSNETTAPNYRNQLQTGYEFIHLMAHSCPWAHTFRIGSGYGGCFFNYDLDMMEPHAFFYNLFACSNTRFVELDNIGNYYIFQDDYGLAVVGSTKTGSMLEFQDFYGPLGSGDCFGRAFLEWFQAQASGGFSYSERSWFYGMSVLGDPTLQVNQSDRSIGERHPENPDNARTDPGRGASISSCAYSDGNPVLLGTQSETVMCAWMSGIDGRSSICTNFHDGSGWSGQVQVYPYEYWEVNPALLYRSNGDIWIFFARFTYAIYNYDIYCARWTGTSWTTPQVIQSEIGYDVQPAAAERDGTMHVVWQSWRDLDADLYWSQGTGSTWSTPQSITVTDCDDVDPQLICNDDGNLLLTYTSRERGKWDVVFRRFDGSWSSPEYVSSQDTNDTDSSIAAIGDRRWIAYLTDLSGNSDLAAVHFDGTGWGTPELITETPDLELHPRILVNSDSPVIGFYTRGNDQILKLAVRQPEGTWSIQILENSSGRDQYMDLIQSGSDTARTVWCTDREGDSDIYSDLITLPTTPDPTPTAGTSPTVTQPPPTDTPVSPSSTPTGPTHTPASPTSTSPPGSPTVPPTNTPPTTYTVLPSITPTPDNTAIPTVTPTSGSQSPTPESTDTPGYPTSTATPPGPPHLVLTIQTNQDLYRTGDLFRLTNTIQNGGPTILLDEYILLDVFGQYWFWPGWSEGIDWQPVNIPGSETMVQTILEFIWPGNTGSASGLIFWAALLKPETAELACDYSFCSFAYDAK